MKRIMCVLRAGLLEKQWIALGWGLGKAAWCRCHVQWFSQPLACPRAVPGVQGWTTQTWFLSLCSLKFVGEGRPVITVTENGSHNGKFRVPWESSAEGSQQSQGMLQEGLLGGMFKRWSEGWSRRKNTVKIWWWEVKQHLQGTHGLLLQLCVETGGIS